MTGATDTATTTIPSGTWVVDVSHSQVGFAVKHLGISTVRGAFDTFEGVLEIGEDLSASRAYGTIEVGSVDTKLSDRDEQLRSADFFDVGRFPVMMFESTRIEAVDDDGFRVTGLFTIHGVTNEIVLHARIGGTERDAYGYERVGLEVSGQLSRSDYGMKFQQVLGSGNLAVADKVVLALDLSATKQA